ncbi:MAG: hypothetical protein LJE67_15975 [Salaquimonas sp.]|jgi:hypothetical protein|nr:hypothetical protein [Salaquimonas sp.]
MNAAIIVMTILGCGQNEAACEFIRTVDTPFSSQAQCEARMETELMKTAANDYPNAIAMCEPLDTTVTGPRPHAAPVPGREANARPHPDTLVPAAPATPTVIYSQFDAPEKPHPLRWAASKTRQTMNGVKRVVVNTWRKITGKDREEPILLDRYAEADI